MPAPSTFRPLDAGLFVLRVAVGLNFTLVHGLPKLIKGPDHWLEIGLLASDMGTRIAPAGFGLIAALVETFGGLFLIFGLYTRLTSAIMVTVPFVATLTLLHLDSDMWHYPALTTLTLVALALTGAGHYAKDARRMMDQVYLQRTIHAQALERKRARATQHDDLVRERLQSDSIPGAPQSPPPAPSTVQGAPQTG